MTDTEGATIQLRNARLRGAIFVAAFSAAYATLCILREPARPTDFDQIWFAARELLAHRNPYNAVGPGKAFEWQWPLYYPLPALIVALPLTTLPAYLARIAFSTIAGGVLGYALAGRLRIVWPLFLSSAFLLATARTQWSPLFLAALFVPALGVFLCAKPNIGVAILAGSRARGVWKIVAGIAAILTLSFAMRPSWLSEWRQNIADSPHIVAPIAMPLGFLLALAALKFRRADARLFLVLAIVPHTPSLYDLLPLFFVCRTFRDTLWLALLTHVLFWTWMLTAHAADPTGYALELGRLSVLIVYLPVLGALLLRPNVSDDMVPAESPNSAPTRPVVDRLSTLFPLTAVALASAFLMWISAIGRL